MSFISGPPIEEVRDETQSIYLALLGMELRADQIAATDNGGEAPAMVALGQHVVLLLPAANR